MSVNLPSFQHLISNNNAVTYHSVDSSLDPQFQALTANLCRTVAENNIRQFIENRPQRPIRIPDTEAISIPPLTQMQLTQIRNRWVGTRFETKLSKPKHANLCREIAINYMNGRGRRYESHHDSYLSIIVKLLKIFKSMSAVELAIFLPIEGPAVGGHLKIAMDSHEKIDNEYVRFIEKKAQSYYYGLEGQSY